MHLLLIFLLLLASYVAADEKCVVEAPFYVEGWTSEERHSEWINGEWKKDGLVISTHENISSEECLEKCRQEPACGYSMPEGECSKAAFEKSMEKWTWLKYSSVDRAVRIHIHDNNPYLYVMEFRQIKDIDK